MKHDEHDELWELLGKAREPKDSPFFASKVLRAIHQEQRAPARLGFWQWLRRSWLVSSMATATAVIAVVFALNYGPVPGGSGDEVGTTANVDPLSELGDAMSAMSDQYDVGTSLPDLLATEDHSVWLQADPSSLF